MNIRLRGHLSDKSMEPLLLNIFAGMVNKFPTYPASSYAPQYLPIRTEVEKIRFVISLFPEISAQVDVKNNEMQFSLFPLFTILNMAEFARPILEIVSANGAVSVESVDRAIRGFCASDGGRSVNALFEIWKSCEEQVDSMQWDMNAFPNNPMVPYALPSMEFIIRHEMSHWNLSRMSAQFRGQIFQRTRQHMYNFLRVQTAFSPGQTQEMRRFLQNPLVELSWLEELSADTMSCMAMLLECGDNAYRERDFYISLAIAYAMLKLTEAYEFYEKGRPIPYSTHPAAAFRERFVEFVICRESGAQEAEFARDVYAANICVQSFFNALINSYCGAKEANHGR